LCVLAAIAKFETTLINRLTIIDITQVLIKAQLLTLHTRSIGHIAISDCYGVIIQRRQTQNFIKKEKRYNKMFRLALYHSDNSLFSLAYVPYAKRSQLFFNQYLYVNE